MTVLALDVARLAFWLLVSLVASLAALAIAIASGFGTASINRSKGRSPRAGFWLGFCLPVVALAVAALLPDRPSFRPVGEVPSRRVLARVAVGVGAASLLVPVAALVIYTQFINDPEPRLDTNDLADLVGGDSATTSSAGAAFVNAALITSSADAEASDDTTDTTEAASSECAVEQAATETTEAAPRPRKPPRPTAPRGSTASGS